MSNRAQGERLRIAYIVGAFPDVSETFLVAQIVGMAARGHYVDIYTTRDRPGCDTPSEVRRYGLPARTHSLAASKRLSRAIHTLGLLLTVGWRAPRVVARLLAVMWKDGFSGWARLAHGALTLVRLNARRYDVIHAQFGSFGLLATKLVDVGAVQGAVVTSFRGWDLTKHARAHPAAYERLLRRGTLFLPVSRALAQLLIDVGCDRGRIRIHHSGIACRRLRYRESRPCGDEAVRVISVARLVEKKGIAYAVKAIARVIASGKRVSYTVVGEGPLRPELESLIRALGVAGHVRLVGARAHDDTLAMIDAAHILIAPSVTAPDGDAEGIPNSLKEAMAMGLPVIGTRHGGIPELVEDAVSGFLVPERDVSALAGRLSELIAHPERWAAMGRAGRRRVEAEYDIDRLSHELVGLYRKAAARNAAARHSSAARPTAPAVFAKNTERSI